MNILETIKELIKASYKVEFWDVDKRYLTFFFECQLVDTDVNDDGIYDDVLYICGSDEGYITHYEGIKIDPSDIKLKLERSGCPELLLKFGMEYYENGRYSNWDYRKDVLKLWN